MPTPAIKTIIYQEFTPVSAPVSPDVFFSPGRYQDFAPMFTCSDFDPAAWAKLFKQSGARGLTMTSKHQQLHKQSTASCL